jgi:hypothetical protein
LRDGAESTPPVTLGANQEFNKHYKCLEPFIETIDLFATCFYSSSAVGQLRLSVDSEHFAKSGRSLSLLFTVMGWLTRDEARRIRLLRILFVLSASEDAPRQDTDNGGRNGVRLARTERRTIKGS